jgi:CBS-domain-containing membrane protein
MFVHEVRKHMEQGGKTHAVVVAVSPSATFKHIVEKIATSHHHRVFLVDDEYRPVGVISVSDVCKLLAMEMVKPAEAEEQPQAAAGLLVKAPPPVPKRDKQQ